MPNDNETTPSINISVELSNIENFDNYTKSYEKVKQAFLDEETLTSVFKRQITKSFAEHPTVEGVQWEQYTPYFNDGEPCTFSGPYSVRFCLSSSKPVVEEEATEDQYDDDEDDDSYEYDDGTHGDFVEMSSYRATEDEKKIIESFKWITELNDDFLLAMFGDDAKVTIRRDLTVKIREFNHD